MVHNVVIVGVLDKKGSTNIPQALAFMKQGLNVIPVNYRTIISTHKHDYFYELMRHVTDRYKPILTLFSKCNGIDSEIVKYCSERGDTWLWNMDSQGTIEQCPEVIEHAKVATFASCTSETTAKWFEEQGVEKCHTILEGLDVSMYKPVDYDVKYKADISHIGTKTAERDKYLKLLQDSGYDVKFYGPGYTEEVVGEEFSKICSSSKYMLSLNTWNNVPRYFSDRIIRYLGCGACTFHLDSTNTLNDFFQGDKEIVYFNNTEDLLYKLSKMNTEKAMNMSLAGRDRVLNNYTWNHSIRKLIDILNQKHQGK